MEIEKIVRYQDVKNQTTKDFFKGNEFSIDAFEKKYTITKEETITQAIKRVCDFIASVEEKEEDKKYWSERWFDELYNGWWFPAGSIIQGANSGKNISLVNCTTINFGINDKFNDWDNLESIIKNVASNVAKYAAFRQGQGLDFSKLRPKETKVMNSSNESQGCVHWMKFIDSIGYYVGQKGRIPAMLFSLSIKHPDIEEFITIKSDYTKVQNANISVQITNDFYKQIENDGDWELKFEIPEKKIGDKIYIDKNSAYSSASKDKDGYYYVCNKNRKKEIVTKKVKAKYLLELIARNMCANAEPGVQNIDIAKKYSNSDYVYDHNNLYDSRISSTNACSEQYLSPDSCCVLASINCGKFSIEPEKFEKELDKIGHSINRFLDNVNECELKYHTYATPEQKLAIQMLRRTGAGCTNLSAWLLKNNLEYGSEKGNEVVEKFIERYNYYLYKSSIELGKQKGNFGLFKRNKFEESPFIKRMMKLGLDFHHMRNVTCSSIAPTGTLSLMFSEFVMSYGIEPAFGIYFWKRTRMAGKYEYYFCVPNEVRKIYEKAGYKIPMESDSLRDTWDGKLGKPVAKFIEDNKEKVGIKFKDSTQVSVFNKLDLMSRVMKWVDSSISVTYMLPEGSDWQDVYKFILEANKKEVKSIAAFPDKKMYGIVSFIPFKELAIKLQNEGISIHKQNFSEQEITELKLPTEESLIKENHAPKRPKSLKCDIYFTTCEKEQYYVIVGKLNSPYELFVGLNHYRNNIVIPNHLKDGELIKEGKGKYYLLSGEHKILLTNGHTDYNCDALTRLVSSGLRHGVSPMFLVEQLLKNDGDMFVFSKVISRILKKYIKDGTKGTGSCPECGSEDLIYKDGCVSCVCSWQKCS